MVDDRNDDLQWCEVLEEAELRQKAQLYLGVPMDADSVQLPRVLHCSHQEGRHGDDEGHFQEAIAFLQNGIR